MFSIPSFPVHGMRKDSSDNRYHTLSGSLASKVVIRFAVSFVARKLPKSRRINIAIITADTK
jgi:hypothetical protein